MPANQLESCSQGEKPKGGGRTSNGAQSCLPNGKLIVLVQTCCRCGGTFAIKRNRQHCPRCGGLLRNRAMIVKVDSRFADPSSQSLFLEALRANIM
jgi:ribosomal protein S27AE